MTRPSGPDRRALLAGLAGSLLPGMTARAAAADTGRPGDTRRIVSLGGDVTETLYDLGLADAIVALDTTSTYPPDALGSKPNVGYLRQLSAEGILAARPTLVLAAEGAGPPAALDLVRGAGVPVVPVPDEPTPAGLQRKIEVVSGAVGREGQGADLAAAIAARFEALARLRGTITTPARVLFILSLSGGRAIVGGHGTTADGMLRLAGADNLAAGIEGYKPMSDEALVAAAPDWVVMMANGPGGHAPVDLSSVPALAASPAARPGRLLTMDGLYLLGWGPRAPDAALDLMRALHPDLPRG